ncbi:putative integrase [Cucumis melo var. makuwa]|uniref:Integrase n=1 Tax=Cucumis melo var. makuwa TaxID=1194695 RepID=A0A5A7T412_CUCMM|nr:putative integrase [Cucumis melo var. makuwa]
MKKVIKNYVEKCEICQRNETESTLLAGLIQPIPLSKLILEDWSMDFVEGLLMAENVNVNVIMGVVDRLSKYAYFVTLKHPFSANQVAEAFIDKVVRKHGVPKSIINDQDNIFLSNFWKELFSTMGTSLKRNTTFHPQTDRQTKRVN